MIPLQNLTDAENQNITIKMAVSESNHSEQDIKDSKHSAVLESLFTVISSFRDQSYLSFFFLEGDSFPLEIERNIRTETRVDRRTRNSDGNDYFIYSGPYMHYTSRKFGAFQEAVEQLAVQMILRNSVMDHKYSQGVRYWSNKIVRLNSTGCM